MKASLPPGGRPRILLETLHTIPLGGGEARLSLTCSTGELRLPSASLRYGEVFQDQGAPETSGEDSSWTRSPTEDTNGN